ncbi:DUF2264 domain-containing protein [Streptomyces sp. NPDC003832]
MTTSPTPHGTSPTRTAPPPPPPDRTLSPLTGYTRAHWEATADRLLTGLLPYATQGLAQYRLPGRAGYAGAWSDGLEGFARSFLLAAFRIAGAGGRDLPGKAVIARLTERYAAGLSAGTDPAHPECWPPITDRSQPMVEAACVAIALHETRPWLWDRLDERTRQNTVRWLGGFVGAVVNDSNWRLFQVVVEEFLASVGAPHRRSEIEDGLARLEDWYRGEGWYTDGDGQKFDYYNAWALHLYPVLWARIAGPRADPSLVARHRDRLSTFLLAHQHFFGSDGAPIHQGRSLIYRYGTTAPLWAAALCDASPLPPGRLRRLASGALRHFAEHDATTDTGLLTLGWHGPYPPMTQPYSGPASPYWAAKAFLGLLLPADHPVWTAVEEPAPVDTGDHVVSLPGPGWLLHSTAADGIVRLVNHGSDHQSPPPTERPASPHYTRFAYSSATAPQTPPDERPVVADHHVRLEWPDTEPPERRRIHRLACGDGLAASWHGVPDPSGSEADISTTSVVHGPWEVRVHRVRAAAGAVVGESGWAVADDSAPCTGETGPGWALARRSDGLTAVIAGLLGWDGEGGACRADVVRGAGLNALGHHSALPTLTAPAHPGDTRLLVTLVALSRDPALVTDPRALHRGAHARLAEDGSLDVRFPDGTLRRVPALERP